MSTSTSNTFFDNIQENVKQMVGDRLLLAKMEAAEKAAKLSGKFMVAAATALLSFFVLLFISLMGAYYFAQVFDSFFIGFAVVAGFYLVILLLFIWKGKKTLFNFVQSTIIATIFDDEPDDDDHPEKAAITPQK